MLKYNFSIVIDAGFTVAIGAAIGGGAAWYFYGKKYILNGCFTGSIIAFQMSLLAYAKRFTEASEDFNSTFGDALKYNLPVVMKCLRSLVFGVNLATSYIDNQHTIGRAIVNEAKKKTGDW